MQSYAFTPLGLLGQFLVDLHLYLYICISWYQTCTVHSQYVLMHSTFRPCQLCVPSLSAYHIPRNSTEERTIVRRPAVYVLQTVDNCRRAVHVAVCWVPTAVDKRCSQRCGRLLPGCDAVSTIFGGSRSLKKILRNVESHLTSEGMAVPRIPEFLRCRYIATSATSKGHFDIGQ